MQLNTAATYGPNCSIHHTAEIGDDCVIGAGAYIGPKVSLGPRSVIGPGAVIGNDGFGYEWQEEYQAWVRRPHPYGVLIGADVDIGANACVDRGRTRATVISRGTKIDNLVHVAHNVLIGQDCIIVAGAEISGSCVLWDRAWIGPNACIRQGLSIGEYAMVGMGAVVTREVPAGMVVAGNPARVLRERTAED
jgi:UDP-3-O-[3-hydroxymyristoyl] glucosamine N-acyltransferase